MSVTLQTGTGAAPAQSAPEKPRFLMLQPLGLRAVALFLAVSSWMWFSAIPHDPEPLYIWLAGPIALFYSLLAVGAFAHPRRECLSLRSRWLLPAMIALPLPVVISVLVSPGSTRDRLILLAIFSPVIVVSCAVFRALKRLTLSASSLAATSAGRLPVLAQSTSWASRILSSNLLLLAGSGLLFYFAWPGDLSQLRLPFSESWITGQPSFTFGQFRDYAGRSVFGLSLALALVSLWFAARNLWRPSPARPSPVTAYLALMSALLLGYSQLDAFFAFVQLSLQNDSLIVHVVWLLTTLTALAAIIACRVYNPERSRNLTASLLLLGFPVLAGTSLLLPPFAADEDYQIRVAAGTYIAVALLAWGWLKQNSMRRELRAEATE